MANIAIKCRIYPDNKQTELINKTFGCCRKVWNLMLADRQEAYRLNGTTYKPGPAIYKEEYAYLKEVDSLALNSVYNNLERAYDNFFRDLKKKGKNKTRFPKFKSKKKAKKSYTTNLVNGNIVLEDKYIKLPKLGKVKIKLHRLPEQGYLLKSVTISKDSKGDYYASILFEYEESTVPTNKQSISEDKVLGLDYKSNGLYVDSEGNCVNMPHFYRKKEKKLAKAQRKLSKKVGNKKNEEKSKNYLKQLKKVNTIYRKVANQRKDFLHKLSYEITNRYELICIEDIDMKAISNKKFRNGKATMDNGYGYFKQMLAYKQHNKGHYLVKVDKFYPSSQTCHKCGCINKEMKDLSKRTYVCPVCGEVIDRDLNAAINIKQEGMRIFFS